MLGDKEVLSICHFAESKRNPFPVLDLSKELNTTLEPRKYSLLIRIVYLILLLGFTPFAVAGIYEEGKYYGIFFYLFIVVMVVPDFFIKLFLKPVSAVLEEKAIALKYYHGTARKVFLDEINGHSLTEEQTNYGKKKGLFLYLKNGKHVDFTEINLINISPLVNYLELKKEPYYGMEKSQPWYSRKYKYDRCHSL